MMANSYQFMLSLVDDYFKDCLTPIIPITKIDETKCEYPDHNLHTQFCRVLDISNYLILI